MNKLFLKISLISCISITTLYASNENNKEENENLYKRKHSVTFITNTEENEENYKINFDTINKIKNDYNKKQKIENELCTDVCNAITKIDYNQLTWKKM